MSIRVVFALLIATLALVSTSVRAQTASGTITGTVSYLQRSALPENSVVVVRLRDVSRQDTVAPVVAEQQIAATGKQPPIPFTLTYDPAKIDARGSYSVEAVITVYGQTQFRSTTANLVITQGRPTTIDVVVSQISTQLPSTDTGTLPLLLAAIVAVMAFVLARVRRVNGQV